MYQIEIVETKKGIEKLRQKVDGISVAEIAGIIKEDIWQNFAQSRNISGGSLKALSKGRINDKMRKGFALPSKVLYASGQLAESTVAKRKKKDEWHVEVKSGRHRTPDNAKGQSVPTNIQLLEWLEKLRPVWGLSRRVKEKLSKRLEYIINAVER